MPAHGAAPGDSRSTGRASASTGGVRSVSHPLPGTISPAILERLRVEGVESCEAWRALPARRRRALWGITRRMCVDIDAAVREAHP